MVIEVQLPGELSLRIGGTAEGKTFPTHQLQKGLRLVDRGTELVEEGVGFGVPVVKCGLTTYFPGAVELESTGRASTVEIEAKYSLNLVERLSQAGKGTLENRFLYGIKNLLAAVIRKVPPFRKLLTQASSQVRAYYGFETTYAKSDNAFSIPVIYSINSETGRISIRVVPNGLPPDVTEVVVMNEQGAVAFDNYSDSSEDVLKHDEILCWDEVTANQAWFESGQHKIAFSLDQIPGARLYRGRELIDSRLAWAGFGYSFHPRKKMIDYVIRIKRT